MSRPILAGFARLPLYPNTLNLKTQVHTRPVGERPLVELKPTDHPLAVEQRHGITMDRVRRLPGGFCTATDDELHQFIAVIDNWITVAMDTHTKYGTWATATQL